MRSYDLVGVWCIMSGAGVDRPFPVLGVIRTMTEGGQ